MINRFHSVVPLFPRLFICARVALTEKQSKGIHYFQPLHLRVNPPLPCISPQMSGLTVLLSAPAQCSVSRPTCHCQWVTSRASRLGLQAHQHLPGVPEATCRLSVPGQARAVVGSNGGGLCPEEKAEEGAEALPCLEHMVFPAILEPVGHLWMEPLTKAGFVSVCAVVKLCLSFFLAETCCSVGTGTREWAKNSWPIQSRLLPHRKPSPYPLCLAHQHPQTHRGDLALFLSLLTPFFLLPLCPLAAFSVWI